MITSAEHVALRLEEFHRRAAAVVGGAQSTQTRRDEDPDPSVIAEAVAAGAELRLPILARTFGLSPLDSDIVVCLLAAEADPFFRILIRSVQRESGRPCLEVGTVAELLDVPTREFPRIKRAFDPSAPLRRWALIQSDAANEGVPIVAQRFRLDPRIIGFLFDEDELPERMTLHPRDAAVPASVVAPASFERIRRAESTGEQLVVELLGRSSPTSQACAHQLASSLGRALVTLDLSTADVDSARQLAALEREARLANALPAVLHWASLTAASATLPRGDADAQAATGRPSLPAWLARWVEHHEGVLFVTSEDHEPMLARHAKSVLMIDVPFPTPHERARLLDGALSSRRLRPAADVDLATVTRRFALDAPLIEIAARTAEEMTHARAPGADLVLHSELVEACRRQVNHDLKSVAERVEHSHHWEDLVIPVDVYYSLKEMTAFIKHAPRVYDEWGFGGKHSLPQGVSALFAGPPGTGKTMCASVMARELDMELFRVDLSRVVSKWIGETEKNLSKVFDEAQHSNAIILFDEADSLFAKRTEVRSSVDRYANLEVNFLLQRMESFGGITILTTNFEDTIDTAFKRRLTFKLRFEKPDADARAALWGKMFPASCALASDVDFAALGALYEMSGGNIRSAVLRAAFLAAEADSPITMAICKQACQRESREMGLLVRTSEEIAPPVTSMTESVEQEVPSDSSTAAATPVPTRPEGSAPRLVPITRPRR